ncbi:MAG: DNA primase [Coriobacteriales bacterium]|jgi:DNA primase|nr:DNA primase [Coriobacteriales bacterium]
MITEEEIRKVRDATDLVSLVGERVVLKQRRHEFWGCCPFHNERSPSFKIDPTSQFYHCFGCGEHGDAFTFTMKVENVEFPDAVRLLAQRAGIELSQDGSPAQRGRKSRLLATTQAATEFFQQQLMRVKTSETDAARDYLSQRGLGGEVAREWQLGYAPGARTMVRRLSEAGFSAEEMTSVDLARHGNSGVNDRFYRRIIFPICDLQGRPIAFGGRIFLSDDESNAKYLNSSETPLFKKRENLYAIHVAKSQIVNLDEAIVVEGYTDAITLHQGGLKNTVATLGTALTPQHLKLLSRFCKRVVLLFDGDEAGQRAAKRALDLLPELNDSATGAASQGGARLGAGRRIADVFVAHLPAGQDPADFCQSQGGDALRELLVDAEPLLRYGVDCALVPYDLAKSVERARAVQEALQLLAPLRGSLLVTDELNYISDRLLSFDGTFTTEEVQSLFQRIKPPHQRENLKQDGRQDGRQGDGAGRMAGDSGVTGTAEKAVGAGTAAVGTVAAGATGAAVAVGAGTAAVDTPTAPNAPRVVSVNQQRLEQLERELLLLYSEQSEVRDLLKTRFLRIDWINKEHQHIAEILVEMNHSGNLFSELTARYPKAGSILSVQRMVEASSLEPLRLAAYLLFNLRDLQLKIAIDALNTQLRQLSKDQNERYTELFTKVNELIQERSHNAKNYRKASKAV